MGTGSDERDGPGSPASISVRRRIEWSDTDAFGQYPHPAALPCIGVAEATSRCPDARASGPVPESTLAGAPESPWTSPVSPSAGRLRPAPATLTPSNRRALEALPEGGTVLDVGCGAGAASLALVPKAGRLIGVDPSASMLEAFQDKARAAEVPSTEIEGSWPEVAAQTPVADVVVCHHVAYNVPDLAPFVLRLIDHATHRVVMEMTA